MTIIRKTVLLSLLCVVGWQFKVNAHGVAIEYQATQAYEVKAAYDTGEPMANAQVAVFSPNDPAKPWLTGTTDAEGRFVFSPSASGNWEVQVRQAGHGDVLVIPVEDGAASTTRAPATHHPKNNAENTSVATGVIDNYTPLQKGLMIGAVIWGCVGTALFFARGRKGQESDAHS
ncbi:MAG: carboxypeptidase-like regulatory domain-containing protein [Leptolyngbyaceae bacterium]|nr:carboxypeptidase-like regulatory domain-containing protein [Leptolyngbyaceae bacterium]